MQVIKQKNPDTSKKGDAGKRMKKKNYFAFSEEK
jgi:hypothetical protein